MTYGHATGDAGAMGNWASSLRRWQCGWERSLCITYYAGSTLVGFSSN